MLDDGTEWILVDPADADLELAEEQVLETDDGTAPTAPARAILEELGREVAAESSDEYVWRRFYERRLDPGVDVHVYGPVATGPAEDAPGNMVGPYVGGGDGATFVVLDADTATANRRHLQSGLRWLVGGLVSLAVAAGLVVLL